jgi:hypothetical protein
MSKPSTAIMVALITAAGGIVTALITTNHGGSPGPSPSPSASFAPGTIQVPAGDTYAYLYSVPTGDLYIDRVGEMSSGTNVQIICTVQGPAIGTDGDTLWDKVVYNTGSAYISDIYVYTGSSQAQMPSCP